MVNLVCKLSNTLQHFKLMEATVFEIAGGGGASG